MDRIALYDLNPQQKYTEYLLTNYSEKKQFYVLDAEERNYLHILQNEHKMKKNPTWLGLMIQNVSQMLSKVTQTPYFETISNYFGGTQMPSEFEPQKDTPVDILSKAPIVGLELIKEPTKETVVDVSKVLGISSKQE